MMKRITPPLAGLAALVALFCLPATTQAQQPAYPSKPIRFVVASAAGTGVDLITRAFAERVRALAGVPTMVENKVGANGAVGAAAYLQLPPDGYSVLTVTSSSMNLTPLTQKLPYDIRQLRPLLGFSRHTGLFLTSTDTGYKSLKDVVDASRSMPGGMNIGTYSLHFLLAQTAFQKQTGAVLTNVAYKGLDAFGGLIDGSIPLLLADLGTSVKYVGMGKVRALATAADKRHPSLPNVPTVAEAGYPKYEVYEIAGFAINADTPEPQFNQLEALLLKVAADPEYIEMASRLPAAELTKIPGREFAAMLAKRREEQRALLESVGGIVQ